MTNKDKAKAKRALKDRGERAHITDIIKKVKSASPEQQDMMFNQFGELMSQDEICGTWEAIAERLYRVNPDELLRKIDVVRLKNPGAADIMQVVYDKYNGGK